MKLLLIKKGCPVPEDFEPSLFEVCGGMMLDRCAAVCMRRMLYCAAQNGIRLKIVSAYRSAERQQELIDEDVRSYMRRGMSKQSALYKTHQSLAAAGESEHNAGLAADLADGAGKYSLCEAFSETAEFRWLMQNSWKFGYILRYPADKTKITGICYEPWHFRYVGFPHAEIITRRGLTLEEYLAASLC